LTNATGNAKFPSIGEGKGLIEKKEKAELFDEWPEKYDQWFSTPIGTLVKKYETELILDLLKPSPGETILDAGCGTGVFTLDILASGAHVIGMDISLPMLRRTGQKARKYPFQQVLADISSSPFSENVFDKVVSITALEFIKDPKAAITEIFRVTKRGGIVVVSTLNSLSPWATRRKAEARKGHALFQKAIFRSPNELCSMAPLDGIIKTAVHFQKDENPAKVPEIELEGDRKGLDTGAFVAIRWRKP
jgi:ubiquinone/menaquinone biosynthesis C-methylase UbiE